MAKDLNSKLDISTFNTEKTALTNSINSKASKDIATVSANGLMSSADKTKLNGIATGANAYTHPTSSGNKHIPSGGASGQFLKWSSDGTAVWASDNNTTYSAGTGLSLSGTTFSANIGTGSTQVAAGNHTHSYLPLTGGTLSGNVVLNNNIAIGGKDSSGTTKWLTWVDSSNNAQFGDISLKSVINSNVNPEVNISGKGICTLYHTGNKPSASDIGALPTSGGTVNGRIVCKQLTVNDYGTPLEIGAFIDFHTSGSTSDYDGRFYLEGGKFYSTQGLFGINATTGIGTALNHADGTQSTVSVRYIGERAAIRYGGSAASRTGFVIAGPGDNAYIDIDGSGQVSFGKCLTGSLYFNSGIGAYNANMIAGPGNYDSGDGYGKHNLFSKCWWTWGYETYNGLTNMYLDTRLGKFIGKGGAATSCSRDIKSDIRAIGSENQPMTINLRKGERMDTRITLETITDFLDSLQLRTYAYDYAHEGFSQDEIPEEAGGQGLLQLGFIADDVEEHPLFKYVGVKHHDGLHSIDTMPMIAACVAGYKAEKFERMNLQAELEVLRQELVSIKEKL